LYVGKPALGSVDHDEFGILSLRTIAAWKPLAVPLLLAAVRIRKSTAMWRMLVVLSSFCRKGAVVLAAVNDAARRFAVAFGHH
jgi:hypothetical protein